jgi:hypothetical protein
LGVTEAEERLKISKAFKEFSVRQLDDSQVIGDGQKWSVVYFTLYTANERRNLDSLLHNCIQRRINVIVEIDVDSGEIALELISSGAFWVVPKIPGTKPERLAAIIRAAATSRESRGALFQDLKASSTRKPRAAVNRPARFFVSMNLKDDHEDFDAYNNALRPLSKSLPAEIKSALDHADNGAQGLRERIAGHIKAAELYIAFLSPTGRITERLWLWEFLSLIPYLKTLAESTDGNPAPSYKHDSQRLSELLRASDIVDQNHLFLQSPSVMWEVGYAFALGKTIVFLSKSEYAGARIQPPAMARDAYRIEYVSHTDLALRLFFGLKPNSV